MPSSQQLKQREKAAANYELGKTQWDLLKRTGASNPTKADYIAHFNTAFTARAMIDGLLSMNEVNELCAGGNPYGGSELESYGFAKPR